MPEKTLGQVAYEGYKKKSDGKSLISGAPLPEWNFLKKEIQDAWEAAIDEVVDFVGADFSKHYRVKE